MSLFGIFGGKKANIERESWEGKKEKSPDFPSVSNANHALSTHLASNGSVVTKREVNNDDGHEVTALERIADSRLFGETFYSVKPNTRGSVPD